MVKIKANKSIKRKYGRKDLLKQLILTLFQHPSQHAKVFLCAFLWLLKKTGNSKSLKFSTI